MTHNIDGLNNFQQTVEILHEAGFSLHWLKPRSKAPVANNWSNAPTADPATLLRDYRDGYNLGVRLGEPSHVAGAFLHVLDFDIRFPDLADEAWEEAKRLLPDVNFDELPTVKSGSGGESRHFYFLSDRAFRSKKIARSEGRHRGPDGAHRRDWEIDLLATGKQVVLPPSIHPTTGQPYEWLRQFDFELLPLGIGPFISSEVIERLTEPDDDSDAFETVEPMTFAKGELERYLDNIPLDRIDDRDDWIKIGQALHLHFGGSDDGFDAWMEISSRSSKFLKGSSKRAELRRYRGFGKNKKRPVRLATVVQWAKEAMRWDVVGDDFDAFDDEAISPTAFDFDDLLGGGDTEPRSDLDLLGGRDGDDDVTDLDLLGSGPSDTPELEWISLLDLNKELAIKPTLHNLRLILANDPRTAGLMSFNEFTQETVQRATPGHKPPRRKNAAKPTLQLEGSIWKVRDPINGDLWTDAKDNAIRAVIEAPKTQGGYSLKVAERDMKAAIDIVARQNTFHPVRQYLNGLAWDGVERLERLFIDYLGAEDSAYSRGVARIAMASAVTRIYEPGHKADHVVILEGLQGKRKSTAIRILARHWFAELDCDWQDGKQLVEAMQGAWLLEVPELSGFSRTDIRSIKAFVSRQSDKVRLAYARRAAEYPRQCVFWGSTNDRQYLRDATGGRRWLPLECSVDRIDTEALSANVDQLWAESVALYRRMRGAQPHGTLPLYLSDEEASEQALLQQESRRAEDPEDALAGQIEAWLDAPVQTGSIDSDETVGQRNETCLIELWVDCLGFDRKTYTQANAQLVGRAMQRLSGWKLHGRYSAKDSKFGKQRIWERGGINGRLARVGSSLVA